MSASWQRHYKLHPSRFLTFAIFMACLIVLCVVFVLPFGWLFSSVISLIISLTCVYVLLRDARLNLADSCMALRLDACDSIALILHDGRQLSGRLSAAGVILPFVVLLSVRLEKGGHRSIVLLKDNMDADDFRRLRAVLRWSAKQQDAVSSV